MLAEFCQDLAENSELWKKLEWLVNFQFFQISLPQPTESKRKRNQQEVAKQNQIYKKIHCNLFHNFRWFHLYMTIYFRIESSSLQIFMTKVAYQYQKYTQELKILEKIVIIHWILVKIFQSLFESNEKYWCYWN